MTLFKSILLAAKLYSHMWRRIGILVNCDYVYVVEIMNYVKSKNNMHHELCWQTYMVGSAIKLRDSRYTYTSIFSLNHKFNITFSK